MIKKDLCPAWKAETLAARLHSCRIMLVLHRVMSTVESTRVHKRIAKLTKVGVK